MARQSRPRAGAASGRARPWQPPAPVIVYREGRWQNASPEPDPDAPAPVDPSPIKLQSLRFCDVAGPLALAGLGAAFVWLVWASVIAVIASLLLAAAVARVK